VVAPRPPPPRAPYPGASFRPSLQFGCDAVVGLAYLSFMWTLEYGGISAWLDVLYVVPEHRSHGIGRAFSPPPAEASLRHGCLAVDLEIEATHGARGQSVFASRLPPARANAMGQKTAAPWLVLRVIDSLMVRANRSPGWK